MKKTILHDIYVMVFPLLISLFLLALGAFNNYKFLKMDITDLDAWSWFTSNFVHVDLNHFINNFVLYAFAVCLLYAFLWNKRKLFYGIFLSIIIILPIVQVIFILFFRKIGLFPLQIIYNAGFSGLTSAFVGSLGLVVAMEIRKFTNVSPWKAGLFIFTLSLIGIAISYRSLQFFFVIILFVIMALLYTYRDFKLDKKALQRLASSKKDLFLFTVSLSLFLIILYFIIPSNVLNADRTVATNTPLHFLGFLFGFLISFAFNKLIGDKHDRQR